MSPIDRQNEIEQRMDEAFAAGPDSREERALIAFLAEHPEYQSLWEEYQTLRRGMGVLQARAAPSEMTQARIRQASRERLQRADPSRRGWRWILSQPMIAAATVLLVVGFGIYSQYLLRETKNVEPPLPALEKRALPTTTQPVQIFEKKKLRSPTPFNEAAPAPPPAPEPSAPEAFAPALDSTGGAGVMRSLSEGSAPATAPPSRDQEEKGGMAPSVGPELKAQQVQAPSPFQRLIAQAKVKIAAQDCPGALNLLKEAQKTEDTPEVRALIKQCEKQ
jgi:hypothetical protein